MENEELLVDLLNKDLGIGMAARASFETIKEELTTYISALVCDRFEELINLLYKIDVNEARLKKLLKENPGAIAAIIIAELIIERQLQKMKTRQEFKTAGKRDRSDDEKW